MKNLFRFRNWIEASLYRPEGSLVDRQEILAFQRTRIFGGLEFFWGWQGYSLRFYSPAKMRVDETQSEHFALGAQVAFSLKNLPRRWEIEFPNQYRIRFQERPFKALSPRVWRTSLAALAGAVFVFVVLSTILVKSSLDAFEKASNKKQVAMGSSFALLEDVSLYRLPAPSSRQSTSASISQMISAWDVGRPLRQLQAKKILEPVQAPTQSLEQLSRSWKTVGTQDLRWEAQDDKPLNLSDEEIAKVFSATIPWIKDCYDEALLKDLSLGGSPQVFVSVDLNGFVKGIDLKGLRSKGRETEQMFKTCLQDVYSRLRLPIPNQAFVIRHRLLLESTFASSQGS